MGKLYDKLIDTRSKPIKDVPTFAASQEIYTFMNVQGRTMSTSHYVKLYNEDQREFLKLNKKLADLMGISEHDTIADVGCGTGILGRAIADKVKKYVGIDLSIEALESFKNETLTTANIYLINCDATCRWPFDVKFNKVFFSINTIRQFTPASTQINLLKDISHNYLTPNATIAIIFNNYFKWTNLNDVLSLEHENTILVDNVTWKVRGKYFSDQTNTYAYEIGDNEVNCVLYFESNSIRVMHKFLLTWKPLDFYIGALNEMGFLCSVYGDFSGSAYNPNLSDFAIIKAVRG